MKKLIGLYDPVMSYAAIGRVLGITKGGVKAIERHALRKLRRRPVALRRLLEAAK